MKVLHGLEKSDHGLLAVVKLRADCLGWELALEKHREGRPGGVVVMRTGGNMGWLIVAPQVFKLGPL